MAWSDELRVGLHGQVRRRWAPRGVKVRQVVEVKYQWRSLALAVTAPGRLRWRWLDNLRKESVAETVRAWKADGLRALVWDTAPAHQAKLVRAAGSALVPLPPYSPELNPPERLFEEIRRRAECHVWGTIDAKVAEVAAFLQDLAQHPERVRRLAGWAWITNALSRLPARSFPALP